MIRAAAMFVLLAQPVLAAGSASSQLADGYMACFMSHNDQVAFDREVIAKALKTSGWSDLSADEMEDGMQVASPIENDDAYLLMPDDGKFCAVEGKTIGTSEATAILTQTLQSHGIKLPEAGKDEDGCATYDLGNGFTATMTSAGNDPTCTSDANSGVRFYMSK